MKIPSTNSLNGMFIEIDKLISISFSSKFNTENITDISAMLLNCLSLSYVNLLNLNLKMWLI